MGLRSRTPLPLYTIVRCGGFDKSKPVEGPQAPGERSAKLAQAVFVGCDRCSVRASRPGFTEENSAFHCVRPDPLDEAVAAAPCRPNPPPSRAKV